MNKVFGAVTVLASTVVIVGAAIIISDHAAPIATRWYNGAKVWWNTKTEKAEEATA